MTKPVLAVALLVVLAGAWHVALRPVVAPLPPTGRAPAAAPVPAMTSVPTVRLAQLTAAGSLHSPPGAWRSPFGTVAPDSARGVAPGGVGAPAPAPVAGPTAPEWPRLSLIGVAEAGEGRAVVRTAVVSGAQGVHHARPGDVIEQVYRVERIGADAVDLLLLPEGRALRLSLRP